MSANDDYEVQCPYVRSHMIRRSRIQQHIVKCERNFPGLVMEWCPHNASHRFARHEDYVAHVPNCPDARISSDVLIMMAMKYHETGDVCRIIVDPEKQVDSFEDWALEYDDGLGDEDPLTSERSQDASNHSSSRSSCESEDDDVDEITNQVASLDVNNGVSVLAQITPYSQQSPADSTTETQTDKELGQTPKKTYSAVERHYLRGISIGRGHKLPWLDGKPGKSSYQKAVEKQEVCSESIEKSVGRGFMLRSHLPKDPTCGLRKPANSYLAGM